MRTESSEELLDTLVSLNVSLHIYHPCLPQLFYVFGCVCNINSLG